MQTLQTNTSERLAQGPYVTARVGFELVPTPIKPGSVTAVASSAARVYQ